MTQVHEKERQLHREVAETVESRMPEVEVLAVELGGPEHICVYIDHPDGVDHALCERVTTVLRGVSRAATRVDVSSPGLERPLRTPAHFAGAVGRRVAVRTRVEVGGPQALPRRGRRVPARTTLTLAVGGEQVAIPYDAIVRGNLIEEGR